MARKKISTGLIWIISLVLLTSFSFGYSASSYDNIVIDLSTGYSAPSYDNILLTLEAEDCSPTLNANWSITTTQICDGKEVTTGTGAILISGPGKLILINGANVTASSLESLNETAGETVVVNIDTELIV